jgi:hypothetical protein
MPGKISANCLVVRPGKPRENLLLSSFRREQQKQQVTKKYLEWIQGKNIRKHETETAFPEVGKNAKVGQMRKFLAA